MKHRNCHNINTDERIFNKIKAKCYKNTFLVSYLFITFHTKMKMHKLELKMLQFLPVF